MIMERLKMLADLIPKYLNCAGCSSRCLLCCDVECMMMFEDVEGCCVVVEGCFVVVGGWMDVCRKKERWCCRGILNSRECLVVKHCSCVNGEEECCVNGEVECCVNGEEKWCVNGEGQCIALMCYPKVL